MNRKTSKVTHAEEKKMISKACEHDWTVTSTWTSSIGAVGCAMTCRNCGKTVIV